MPWDREIGAHLRRARKRKKFTQTQLAHELGEGSKATVSTWETGKAEPAEDTKDKLAKVLDIPSGLALTRRPLRCILLVKGG